MPTTRSAKARAKAAATSKFADTPIQPVIPGKNRRISNHCRKTSCGQQRSREYLASQALQSSDVDMSEFNATVMRSPFGEENKEDKQEEQEQQREQEHQGQQEEEEERNNNTGAQPSFCRLLEWLYLFFLLWVLVALIFPLKSTENSGHRQDNLSQSEPTLAVAPPFAVAPPCHVRGNPNGIRSCALFSNSTRLLAVLPSRFKDFFSEDFFPWPEQTPRTSALQLTAMRISGLTQPLSSLLSYDGSPKKSLPSGWEDLGRDVDAHVDIINDDPGEREANLRSNKIWQELEQCQKLSRSYLHGPEDILSKASTYAWCLLRPMLGFSPNILLQSFHLGWQSGMARLEHTHRKMLQNALSFQHKALDPITKSVTSIVDEMAVVFDSITEYEMRRQFIQEHQAQMVWLRHIEAKSFLTSVAMEAYVARINFVLEMIPRMKTYTDPLIAALNDSSTPLDRWAPALLLCADIQDRIYTTLAKEILPAITRSITRNRALDAFERCITYEDSSTQRLEFAGKRVTMCDKFNISMARTASKDAGWPLDQAGIGCVTHPLPLLSWWYEEWCYDGFSQLPQDTPYWPGILSLTRRPVLHDGVRFRAEGIRRLPLVHFRQNKTYEFANLIEPDFIYTAARELGLNLLKKVEGSQEGQKEG